MSFDIPDFLESLEDKNLTDIIHEIDNEVYKVESKLSSIRWAPKMRNDWWYDYINQLKWYLFFLRFWAKPNLVNIWPLKKICTNLVAKKQFNESIMSFFK